MCLRVSVCVSVYPCLCLFMCLHVCLIRYVDAFSVRVRAFVSADRWNEEIVTRLTDGVKEALKVRRGWGNPFAHRTDHELDHLNPVYVVRSSRSCIPGINLIGNISTLYTLILISTNRWLYFSSEWYYRSVCPEGVLLFVYTLKGEVRVDAACTLALSVSFEIWTRSLSIFLAYRCWNAPSCFAFFAACAHTPTRM